MVKKNKNSRCVSKKKTCKTVKSKTQKKKLIAKKPSKKIGPPVLVNYKLGTKDHL